MAIKGQMLRILADVRAAELAFIEGLDEEQRALSSTFETWSAKDILGHVNYWLEERVDRIQAWRRGEELPPAPYYQDANVDVYEKFVDSTWTEIEKLAEDTHEKAVGLVESLDDKTLSGPSFASDERRLWEEIVGVAYDHKLGHFAQFYTAQDQREKAGELWSDWVENVTPLDEGPEWQGRVHYNAACGLALSGNREGALQALRRALELRPSLRAWSRLDSDLDPLHDLPEYKGLFAKAFWWKALQGDPQMEAIADQTLRALGMFRSAVEAFPAEEWLKGESNYQRPAGIALHIVQTIDGYSASKADDRSVSELSQIDWEERDLSKLPSQEEILRYLDQVEARHANFLLTADLEAQEGLFPWTGLTVLSRVLYTLRHTQHHLADMAMELQRRGLKVPDWE